MFKALGVGVAAAVAIFSSPAVAFDTGPHATITEQAMDQAGYNRAAADAVQVENWLTDYYTSSPTFPAAQQCYLEKLHFDDVFTDEDVDAYWQTLLNNTIAAARKAKADNDYVEMYAVMGISLHAVQDFYSHSNWVESSGDSYPAYDLTTYFQWKQRPWRRTAVVHTGWYANCLNIPQGDHTPHGGYTGNGMNHDSVVRPNYNRAYIYAVSASYEWLQQLWQAVAAAPGDRAFANRMMNYQPSQADAVALAYDQKAALYLSEWIDNPADTAALDGHWNGNRSGYAAAFAAFALAWTSTPDSIYVSTFKNRGVYVALSQGLYQKPTGSLPTLYPGFIGGAVVDLRAPRVCATYPSGSESYFGQVVATNGAGPGYNGGAPGLPIRDAAQHHLSCTDTPWEYLTLAPVWSNSVTLDYTLWDEYGFPGPPSASAIPINGAATDLTFSCTLRADARCSWGNKGGTLQAMPARLTLNGSGSKGVTLSNVTLTLMQTYFH
jgi:hypothetical protein